MKKILLSLALVAGFGFANAQNTPEADASVQVESTNVTIDFVLQTGLIPEQSNAKVMDYGTIAHNADGTRKFVFTNNGTEPLLIKNAKGSCGCTVPTWPREAIAPGATAEIGVKYATNRVGKFTKTITLTTNASKKPVILTVKGEVNPAPKEETAPLRKTEGSPLEKK